ncbi:type I-E CRISPR-associated protein Cse1/CasA [Apilactobacillus timberlakei]|uniref:type I-E CRISPR-associated protein Cse1/CasA n=1 Tax=Apilactobacillus timberlakei TaxID=2008380 RepID=UPI0015E83B58|nr:type I-E CRISPR-associated protein Cse1/CasA [Apilactobacillus timberlakei]
MLDENWIKVIDKSNDVKETGLFDIFKSAHKYKKLAGDSAPQDFAILRLLLSILETTFNRYDFDGEPQEKEGLKQTWIKIWKSGRFPYEVLQNYLEGQHEKFYLYSDNAPFCQVTKKDLDEHEIKKTSLINGKLINRLISESGNKKDFFSITSDNDKNRLTNASLSRNIILFLGFSGTADKAKYPGMKSSASKGWDLSLGGIYLEGENLFQTLMLNLMLNSKNYKFQKPIWESSFEDKVHLENDYVPDNLSELYTNCSRLLYIDPNTDLTKGDVQIEAVQLPGIDKIYAAGIEPMTLFQVPKTGNNKGQVIPKMHDMNKSLWRNFGLLEGLSDKNPHLPGVISDFYDSTKQENVDIEDVNIVAVGMTYNRDASSMINGEIHDSLNINREVFDDLSDGGYVSKINDEAIKTEKAVSILKYFIKDLMKMRNVVNNGPVDSLIEEAYFSIDKPFKNWISNMNTSVDMSYYQNKWRKQLYNILINKSETFMYPLSTRDLIGKVNSKTNSIDNVVTRYDFFRHSLKKCLKE